MSVTALTDNQLSAIVIIERVCSSLSLFGCTIIVVTFMCSPAFHKPINRLVFYASLGNIMGNIATLISRSALRDTRGPLCQVQGFLIQWFIAADAYWTLSMACNVYLIFFHKYDAEKIRRIEKWYFLACYGLPFIPAFAYLFIVSSSGNRAYGNATLWCWISSEFDVIRVATSYAPIWVAITTAFFIYIRAGKVIYIKRKQLLSFYRHQESVALSSFSEPFTTMKTTEVHAASEVIYPIDLSELSRPQSRPSNDPQMYSVHVSSDKNSELALPPRMALRKEKALSLSLPLSEQRTMGPNLAMKANSAAWSYTKVAILFFTAMLVTWIPSTANRLYSIRNPGRIVPALEFAAAFVIPLQGFWNAVIYITTSWKACRKFFTTNPFHGAHSQVRSLGFTSHGTESVTELTNSFGTDHGTCGHGTDH